MSIFFDIQGTLLDNDGRPRSHAREVLLKLAGTGHGVFLWPTPGGGYAAHTAWILGSGTSSMGVASSIIPRKGLHARECVPQGVQHDRRASVYAARGDTGTCTGGLIGFPGFTSGSSTRSF